MARKFLPWLPAILWMSLIFFVSTDAGSSAHTSRFLVPLVRWLDPQISETALENIQVLLRKGAHLTEYAILAGLCLPALIGSTSRISGRWSWRAAGYAWLIATAYAATDEFHQSFVPSRGSSVVDVLIDSCGALIGLTIIFLSWKLFQARRLRAERER